MVSPREKCYSNVVNRRRFPPCVVAVNTIQRVTQTYQKGLKMEKKKKYMVGIDAGSETFFATIIEVGCRYIAGQEFSNTAEGILSSRKWVEAHGIKCSDVLICIENCGVYDELLCYHYYEYGYVVSHISGSKVQRAIPPNVEKTDKLDSRRIAEYGDRFYDQIELWQPCLDAVEEVAALMVVYEHALTTAVKLENDVTALKRKKHNCKDAIRHARALAKSSRTRVAKIEKDIQAIIRRSPKGETARNLLTLPGVGKVTVAHVFITTNGFTVHSDGNHLAAHLGISPQRYQSGTSVKRRSASRGFGPKRFRATLHMASKAAARTAFKEYYQRMADRGKHTQLIYNNIANKIIHRICVAMHINGVYDKESDRIVPVAF